MAISNCIGLLGNAVSITMLLFGVLFTQRLLVRNPRFAMLGVVLVMSALTLGGENFALEAPAALVTGIVCAVCVARGGMLAAAAFLVFSSLLTRLPLPLGHGAPYTATSALILVTLLGLATYAFRRSMGPRLAARR